MIFMHFTFHIPRRHSARHEQHPHRHVSFDGRWDHLVCTDEFERLFSSQQCRFCEATGSDRRRRERKWKCTLVGKIRSCDSYSSRS